tara:strand:- start:460 stop:894 length:435 start_codon:yes stop_codon:yes gene_type:complete
MSQSLNYRATADDFANENRMKADLEQAWNCTLHHLPHLYHVDFFAERDDDLVAWVEVKQRSCVSDQYRTVFMNVGKKFEHLVALSVVAPAFFVVRWADGVTRFIDVADVDSGWVGVGGEHDRWGAGRHDLEPVFEIPVERMRVL